MNMKFLMKGAATAVLAVMLLLIVSVGAILIWSSSALGAEPFAGRVVGVADGDTLTVLVDTTPVKVRLAEIDAPEKKQDFGERSKQSLAALCFGQQAVVLRGKTDFYGRTVARVRCQGVDASLHQVQQGLAWAYTAYLTDPDVATSERLAREARLGLWVDAEPTAPWAFRKAKKK